MSEEFSNDNGAPIGAPAGREPDAHGQAALLLVESVLHGLVAKSVFSVAQAIEIVDIASEVRGEIAADTGETPPTLEKSLSLLSSIGTSLRNDLRSN